MRLWVSWRCLGRILGALGSILRANWEAKGIQNQVQEIIRAENIETSIVDDSFMDLTDFEVQGAVFGDLN